MRQQVLLKVTVVSGRLWSPPTFPKSEHRFTTAFHSSANKHRRTWKRPALFLLVKKLLGDSVLILCIILWRWACSRYCRIVPTTIPSRCRPYLFHTGPCWFHDAIFIHRSCLKRDILDDCAVWEQDTMSAEYSFQINSFGLPSPCTTLASIYSDKYLHVR